MAHEISTASRTGQAEAAYALTPAWHGLGKTLDFVPNSEEMMQAAGLDWHVSKRTISVDGQASGTDEYCATVRDDTNTVLGIVGKNYGVVQNVEAFSFLDSLLQDGIMKYESAMALRGGNIVVVVARMPSYDEIADGDMSARYVMFQTSHDGSMKLHAIPTATRVVCMNTLRLALENNLTNINGVRHIGNMSPKLDMLHKLISQFDERFTDYRDHARILAKTKVSAAEAQQYIEKLFPTPKADNLKTSHALTVHKKKIAAIRINQANHINNLSSIKGTWWSLFNSVTEFVDHSEVMRFKGDGIERNENKYLNVVTGIGADLKKKAFDLALAGAGVKS